MSKSLNEIVACNVRFLRQEQGLSTEDLAKLAYMSVGAINNIENNKYKRNINYNNIEVIAKALRVDTDVLLEDNQEVEVLFQQAIDFLSRKDFGVDTAALLDKLLDMTAARGPGERGKAMLLRGELDYNLALYQSALVWFQNALVIVTKGIDEQLIHETRYNLAGVLLVLGQIGQACNLIQTDLDEVQDVGKRVKNLLLLSIAYSKEKLLDQAKEALLTALNLLDQMEQFDKVIKARCYQALGDVYRTLRDHEKSITFSKQALVLAGECQDVICGIYAQKTLAETLFELGELEKAKVEFLKSLELANEIGAFRKIEINKILFALASCDNDYPRIKGILKEIEKLEIAPSEMATFYKDVAHLAMILGFYEDAEGFYISALGVMGIY